jgi:hypothetical protein
MAITSLIIQSAVDTIDENGNDLTAQELWIMELDAPANVVQAYNQMNSFGGAFNFPDLGDSHPDAEALKAINRDIEHYESQQTKFLITVDYSNVRADVEENSSSNPLDLPADYSYEQVDRQVDVRIDAVTDDPIENSAGKPYLGITENKPLDRIVIVRNERFYNNSSIQEIRNTINKTATKIDGATYLAGTLKMESITATKEFDQEDRTYYTITYRVLINPESFKRKFFDQGGVDKNGRRPPNKLILEDGSGYLDGNGDWLAEGAEIVENEFYTLKAVNWSYLRL